MKIKNGSALRISGLLLVASLAALSGCGTSRGYEGRAIPQEQLSTIFDSREWPGISSRKRAIALCQIDDKVVGSYVRGYPKQVQITPGRHTIKVRYLESATKPGAVVAGVLGGAIGGAIYGALAGGPETPYRDLVLDAQAGSSYVIGFDTTTADGRSAAIWIADSNGGEIVSTWTPSDDNQQPLVETEVEKVEWGNLAADQRIKVYLTSGSTYVARANSFDGEYLWISLPEGGRKALYNRDIQKISSIR